VGERAWGKIDLLVSVQQNGCPQWKHNIEKEAQNKVDYHLISESHVAILRAAWRQTTLKSALILKGMLEQVKTMNRLATWNNIRIS